MTFHNIKMKNVLFADNDFHLYRIGKFHNLIKGFVSILSDCLNTNKLVARESKQN